MVIVWEFSWNQLLLPANILLFLSLMWLIFWTYLYGACSGWSGFALWTDWNGRYRNIGWKYNIEYNVLIQKLLFPKVSHQARRQVIKYLIIMFQSLEYDWTNLWLVVLSNHFLCSFCICFGWVFSKIILRYIHLISKIQTPFLVNKITSNQSLYHYLFLFGSPIKLHVNKIWVYL